MSAVVADLESVAAVRDAINERALSIGASDEQRRKAVSEGVRLVSEGKSASWSVSQAIRQLQGKQPAVHGGYPQPPRAA